MIFTNMNRLVIHTLVFYLLHLHYKVETSDLQSPGAKVLIIGGGPAGISAAATLMENGIDDFLILEESDRLRGYVEPFEFGGITFAPGSLWGCTALKPRLVAFDIAYVIPNYSSYTVYNDDGENVTAEAIERENAFFKAIDTPILNDIDEGLRTDLSEKAANARGGWVASTPIDKVIDWFNSDFNEGVSSADISTIQHYRQGAILPNEVFILDDRTLWYPVLGEQEAMISEDNIVLRQRAKVINQTDDGVHVVTEDGSEFIGEFVIVTSTIGVLQHGELTFDPPLPAWKSEEFSRYQMGTIDVIFLQFDSKFWDDTEYILHASDRHGYYPGFLNLEADGYHPAGTNILLGFLAGDEAYRAEHLTDEQVQSEVIEVLRRMYGTNNVPDPIAFNMTRFATDRDNYGSFATWPIGSIPGDATLRLRAPVDRVYFAPEDAGDDYQGYICGSVRGGKYAAEKVAHCYEDEMYCKKDEIFDTITCRDEIEGEKAGEKNRKDQ